MSFRSRKYLSGRCQTCASLDACGCGCSLSCEIEKDHSIDYLFLEFDAFDRDTNDNLSFLPAKQDELSSILQIEWSNFSGYGYIFTVQTIKHWYEHNSNMFYVVKNLESNRVLGFATFVPITESLYCRICNGELSSLTMFPNPDVGVSNDSLYYHLEVIAVVPSKTATRIGRFLVKSVGEKLLEVAKHVTASPVSEIGVRLCEHFGFEHVADESIGNMSYPIYSLNVDQEKIQRVLEKY